MKFLILILLIASCATKQKAMSPTEKKAMIYYNQGTKDLMDRDYTIALKKLIQANNLKPNDTRIMNNLGMAYFFKNDKSKAVAYIKKAIEIDEKNSDARMNLASVYVDLKRYKEANAEYQKVLKDLVYEKQQRTHYNLGILALKTNKANEAIKHFEKSVEVDENYCPAHYQLGLINYRSNQFKDALKNFHNASLGLCYGSPEPIFMKGQTYEKLGSYIEANEQYEVIMSRFTKTKYSALAKNRIYEIRNNPDAQDESRLIEAKSNYNGKATTPDF